MLRMLKKIIADRADCDMLDISLDSKFEDLIPNGEEREATMIYITLDVEDAFDVELPPEAESAETVKDLLKAIRSVM